MLSDLVEVTVLFQFRLELRHPDVMLWNWILFDRLRENHKYYHTLTPKTTMRLQRRRKLQLPRVVVVLRVVPLSHKRAILGNLWENNLAWEWREILWRGGRFLARAVQSMPHSSWSIFDGSHLYHLSLPAIAPPMHPSPRHESIHHSSINLDDPFHLVYH